MADTRGRVRFGAGLTTALEKKRLELGRDTAIETIWSLIYYHDVAGNWDQSGPNGPKLGPNGPNRADLPNVSKSTTSLLLPCDSQSPKPSTSSICPEPFFFAAPKEPEPPSPLIFLPTNKTGVEVAISHTQADEFAGLYPAVDVGQALNDMRGWLIANPSQRKTKNGMLRFVNGWLSKAQNRGVPNGARTSRPPSANDRLLAGATAYLHRIGYEPGTS